MAAQTILTPGQNYGVIGFPGATTDVFITGTAAGAEFISIGDFVTAGFSNNFATGTATDTIRLTGLAANFTISVSGNQVNLVSVTDGINVTLPVGFTGTTIVFESSPGVFGDTRTLKFFADGGDADNLPDLFLGNQQITPNTPAVGVSAGNNPQNTIILTAGQDVITAGASDDTFVAFNNTLNAGDDLDGGAGNNTLKVSTDGNLTNNAFSGFTTENIQTLIFTSDDQVGPDNASKAITVDLSGAVGLQTVESLNSSQDLAFNQLANLVDVSLNKITNPATDGPDVTVQFQDAAVVGANDTVNVSIKTSFADVLTIGKVTDGNSGVENVAITLVTDGNVATTADNVSQLDQLDSDITTLTITGAADAAFTIDDALNNTVRTITASALLGTLDIDFSANDAGGVGAGAGNQGVTFTGAQGANTVLGGNAGDSITTFAGNDVIQSADVLTTTGNDTIDAGEGNNTVTSADGNDSITTGAGNDVINANDGNNTVRGGAGNNSVTTGVGNDTVVTLGGADTISSGDGNDSINSGAGADFITIGAGQHSIDAGLGNDTVVAGANFDARTLPIVDVQDQIDFGDEAGDADELRINAGINGGAGADDFFTNITDGSLEQLTITTSGTTDLTGGADGVNDAQDSGIEIVNLDFGGPNTDNFIATSFTRGLIVNVGKQGDASYAFGGNDTIALGSGSDTVNAAGDNNLTNADRFNAGTNTSGSGDVLNLDGDTTIDNTAVGGGIFTGFETVNLDKNDSGADNDYSLTLNDLNAPTASGTLTVNGSGLVAGETVFLTTAAVTGAGFNVSVTSGAGNDTLISGVKNDTLISGAGSDSVNISLGGSDFVRTGLAADADNDVINAGGALDGTDTIFGGGNAAGTQSTAPFAANFSNGDTLIVTGANAAAAFVNVLEVETVRLDGVGGSVALDGTSSTDIKQVILNNASAQTLNAAGFGGPLIVDASSGGNDAVTVSAGNDTVIAGVGDQKFVLGVGNDTVAIDGTEFTTADSVAGGAGNDTILLDNRAGGVTAAVDLNNVTDVENYAFLASGERGSPDPDASQVSFTSAGNVATVGTLTNINVSAAALTDGEDSLRVLLTAGLADRDFQFTVTGSGSARTVVEKDNLGVTNNIIFDATGAGRDDLIIDGDDAGSTVSMSGGGGQDRIVQAQIGGARSMLSDDGFVNITNVNILTGEGATFGPDGDLNATLGQRAVLTGINQIIDTAGDDDVLLNAAFTNNLSVSVSGGNDSINGGASTATLAFVANGAVASTITATDSLTGGTGLADTLTLRNNETANISGVDGVEAINFTNNALTNQTATVTTDGSNVLSAGQALLNINAGTLNDAGDSLVFTATGGALGYSVTGAAGNDSITTSSGNDVINSGSGNDTVNAGNGNNVIDTSTGNDSVVTGSGNDSITLGSGNDTVFAAGAGNDTVRGGDGNDQVRTDAGNDVLDLGDGADQAFGGLDGDTINLGGNDDDVDTVFYTQRLDSSTSSSRDTVSGFESGTDIIDVRYLAELLTNTYPSDPDGPGGPLVAGQNVYTAGVSQLQFLGNFSEFGGAQGALSTAQSGNVGIVYQQDTRTLWVDLNDDNVLNGDDLQIQIAEILDANGAAINALTAADVLSGQLVGQTNVPSGGSVTGSIIDERFVLQGVGPWTVDGGLGADTVVAANGQDISTVRAGPTPGAQFTNVEFLEIAAGATVFTNVAQYNTFRAQETAGTGGFVNKVGGTQTLSFTDSGVIDGTTGTGVDTYILGAGNDDFELGNSATNVDLGGGVNTFRTQPAGAAKNGASDVDVISGIITVNGANDTWEADSGDNISGATIVGKFETTNLNESSITVTAAQHGTTGNNGLLGTIVDKGDDTNVGGNSPDTITIVDAANITGHASIENYVLSTAADTFTVNAAKLGVNLTSAGGADRVILTGTVPTGAYVVQAVLQEFDQGDYNFAGADDTLQIAGTADIRGVNEGEATTLETLDLATTAGANVVSLTEAQHDAFGAANITGAGQDDTVALFSVEPFNNPTASAGDDGVVTGSSTIGFYTLNGSFDFKVGAAFQSVTSTGGTQTIRVDGLTLTGDITDDVNGDGDILVLSNGGDVSGSLLTNIEALRIDTTGTLTSGQYNAFGSANVTGTSGNDTITLVDDGVTTTVTGDADIENFVLNDDVTFNVVGLTSDVAGRSSQNVTGDGQDQTVVITSLDYRGTIALNGENASDTLSLVGDAVGGAGTADVSQAAGITGVEGTLITGQTRMTLAQHNGALGAIAGSIGGVDQITIVGAGAVAAQDEIENYVLSGAGANTFTFAGQETQSVVTSGNNNDTVITGGQLTFTGVTLQLAGNTGVTGDTLVVDTTGTDLSGLNGGGETTAETLNIDGIADVTMTSTQHEGFTAEFVAAGANTVHITDAAMTINAERFVETYDLQAANTLNVNPLNGAVNLTSSNSTNDVINVAGLTVTGTWTLNGANDTLVATGNADISGVNGGETTTAETLFLNSGGVISVSLTEAQHDTFSVLSALVGNFFNEFVITKGDTASGNDDGVINGNAFIGKYTLNDALTFNLGDNGSDAVGTTLQSVIGDAANNQTVNVTNLIATGTLNGGAGGTDVLNLTDSSISGATVSNFENINVSGAVSMTETQYESAVVDGAGFDDTITLTSADDNGIVIGSATVQEFVLNDSFDFTLGFADQDVTGAAGKNQSINVLALAATGDFALAGTQDTIVAATGADITGVNSGAATTAETLDLTGSITMTAAQHNGFTTAIDAAGGTDQITLSTAGTVTGDADVETYVLAANATSTFTVGALTQNVTETGTADNTLVFDAGAFTGTLTGFEANDTFQVVDTTDLSGATGVNVAAFLDFQNKAGTVTLSQTQHEALGTFVNTTGAQTVAIIGAGAITARDNIENYDLSDDANTFTVNGSELGVNITSTGGTSDTIAVAGLTVTGTYALDGAADIITASTGANIAGVNLGADTTAEQLLLGSGATVSLTAAQHEAFTTITGAGTETLNITTAGTVTAEDTIENYVLQGTGNDTITFAGADGVRAGQSVDVSAGGQDRIAITNATFDTDVDSAVTITGFTPGVVTGDLIDLNLGATSFNGAFNSISGAANNIAGGGATGDLIEINGNSGLTFPDFAGAETFIENAIADINVGQYAVVLYNAGGAGLYIMDVTTDDGDLDAADFSLEYVGLVSGIAINSLTSDNFA